MEFVKKCKRVWGSSSKRLYPEDSAGSGSYGKLSDNSVKKMKMCKKEKKKRQVVAPQGYLWVYVGTERERFVMKIKHVNHPLFRDFLDAAEREHGYSNDGPLWLPCDVDLFSEALADMEMDNSNNFEDHDASSAVSIACGFAIIGHTHRQAH